MEGSDGAAAGGVVGGHGDGVVAFGEGEAVDGDGRSRDGCRSDANLVAFIEECKVLRRGA